MPLSAAVASTGLPAVPENSELAVICPVIAPAADGANSIPAVQLAPLTNTAVQVVCAPFNSNPVVTASCRSEIPDCPEFVTVTIWVALTVPTSVSANVNCAGAIPSAAGVNPIPLKLAIAFAAPLVELDAVSEPVRPPATEGVKLTTTEQLPPAASVPPGSDAQLDELTAKSPEITIVNPVSAKPPVFDTVTVCPALVFPTVVPGKLTAVGLRLRAAGKPPVPVTATTTGATPKLVLDTVTVPLWLPLTVGAKITGTVQLAPAASCGPHVPEPTLKGAVVAKSRPTKVPVPAFVTVKSCTTLLESTGTAPNASRAGVTANCAAANPVPVSPTSSGVNPAFVDSTVTDPIRVPTWLGKKFTAKLHVAPLASAPPDCVPQPFVVKL